MSATLPPKRPAHFDDERDSPKRPRNSDIDPRSNGDRRHDRGHESSTRQARRSPPRSEDRDRRDTDRERRSRDALHHSRDSRRSDRPSSPGAAIKRERSPRRDRSPPRRDRSRSRARHDSSKKDAGPTHTTARPPTQDQRNGHPPATVKEKKSKTDRKTAMDIDPADEEEDDLAELARTMGFRGFRSTKNTKVPGNDKLYGVSKEKKTEYRQYMNRIGGFNRPLSPSRQT